jgi:hypothetical protein
MALTATCSIRIGGHTSRVSVVADGRPVAAADIVDDGSVVRLGFRVDGGHLPVHVRRELVDAVFELPELRTRRPVQASIPLGDVELLAGLRTHCADVDTRAAGSTCLVEAVARGNPT